MPDFGWSRAISLNDGRLGGTSITKGGTNGRWNSGLKIAPKNGWILVAATYAENGTCAAWKNGVRGKQTTCQNGDGASFADKLWVGIKGLGKQTGVVLIS